MRYSEIGMYIFEIYKFESVENQSQKMFFETLYQRVTFWFFQEAKKIECMMFNLHIPSLNWLFDFEIILNIQVRNEKYLIKNQFDSSSKTSLLSIFALLFSYFYVHFFRNFQCWSAISVLPTLFDCLELWQLRSFFKDFTWNQFWHSKNAKVDFT